MKPSPSNATARNIIFLTKNNPVIILKKTTGRKDGDAIIREVKSLNGQGFRVFDSGEDICIVADGSARTFLI